MAVLAPFQLANTQSALLQVTSIIISGCNPSDANGTYNRTNYNIWTASNGYTINNNGTFIFLIDNLNTYLFSNPNVDQLDNYLVETDQGYQYLPFAPTTSGWVVEDGISFGTATNIYSQL